MSFCCSTFFTIFLCPSPHSHSPFFTHLYPLYSHLYPLYSHLIYTSSFSYLTDTRTQYQLTLHTSSRSIFSFLFFLLSCLLSSKCSFICFFSLIRRIYVSFCRQWLPAGLESTPILFFCTRFPYTALIIEELAEPYFFQVYWQNSLIFFQPTIIFDHHLLSDFSLFERLECRHFSNLKFNSFFSHELCQK